MCEPGSRPPPREFDLKATLAAMLAPGFDADRCDKATGAVVTGWLFYDAEHANASANTARSDRHVWRATAWEVHPVTGIGVVGHKRAK